MPDIVKATKEGQMAVDMAVNDVLRPVREPTLQELWPQITPRHLLRLADEVGVETAAKFLRYMMHLEGKL